VEGEHFFQKNITYAVPDGIQTINLSTEGGSHVNYLVCDDLASLLYIANLGCIEINPWNSRADSLEHPDWMVIDLDPEEIGFEYVIRAAQAVKAILNRADIPSFPKTSGKTGIHVYVPLAAKYTFKQVRTFAEIIANLANAQVPDCQCSIERSPSRRKGKVYLDFLQNNYGQTLAAPYSLRPTPEATVSTPLSWDEVNEKLDPKKFTIKTIFPRLKKIGDIWKPVLGEGIDMGRALAKLQTS
jgi:bifunctional non-homologous end joining protein LigD